MTYKYSDYETITFSIKESNHATSTTGMRIGNYLAITGRVEHWKIYRVKQGLPLIDISFKELDDAVAIAEWIDKSFNEYFPLWDEYPEADLFGLLKWTVTDGIQIYEAIKRLPIGRVISKQDFEHALEEAETDVPKWTRDIG